MNTRNLAGIEKRIGEIQQAIAAGHFSSAAAMLGDANESSDPEWIMLHAALAARKGDLATAEGLLRRVQAIAPGMAQAISALTMVLNQQFRYADALAIFDAWLRGHPFDVPMTLQKAATLAQLGKFSEAVTITQRLVATNPSDARVWLSHGHWLKVTGRAEEALSAFQQASIVAPGWAEPWWHIANLKRAFSALDISHMERLLQALNESPDSQVFLHFALAKAHEDAGDYEAAIRHLELGNTTRRSLRPFDGTALERRVEKAIAFMERHPADKAITGRSCPRPIFIVGMPRSGTTLLEQILDSHSCIEGLGELPYIEGLAREVSSGGDLFDRLDDLSAAELSKLGDRYVELASAHRSTDKPFFVDKMPSNWQHLPFIRKILPHAAIIDARRHPMDCCFSNYRQHFPFGHEYAYGLSDLAQYYQAYRGMMEGLGSIGPSEIHAFIYEGLLSSPSVEIGHLMTFLGLEVEEPCLRPHENRRSVATPSAEQVRTPIAARFSGQWRNYEYWLDPLRSALGDAMDRYVAETSRPAT